MKKINASILLFFMVCFFFVSISHAADIAKGLTCPPGWEDNKVARVHNRVKQCISASLDSTIELYATPGKKIPLNELLDTWTNALNQQGFHLESSVSETKGNVSGSPAVIRNYRGTIDGKKYDSMLAASRHGVINYIFLGRYLEGNRKAEQQIRHSLTTWSFPETIAKEDTPYDSLSSASGTKVPAKQSGHSGNFKNFGSCWAWGLWASPSGASVVVLPDGRAVFDGLVNKHWRPIENDNSIIIELPANWGGGSAKWTHPEGRHDAIIKVEHPESQLILTRESWEYTYEQEEFSACHH